MSAMTLPPQGAARRPPFDPAVMLAAPAAALMVMFFV
jgi:hypothetical protein